MKTHPPSKLRCFRCSSIPSQFLLLSCYHLLCRNCISYYRSVQRTPILTVTCQCGVQSLLESETEELIKSKEERVVGEFGLEMGLERGLEMTPKVIREVKVIESGGGESAGSGCSGVRGIGKRGERNEAEETVDRTQQSNNRRPEKQSWQGTFKSSKSPNQSDQRFIKQIGYFTKNLLSSQARLDSLYTNSRSPQFSFNRQLKHFQIQYQKSVQDLKLALEDRIQDFKKAFNEFKRNLKVWYSEMYEENDRYSLTQYAKGRYEMIGKEFDRMLEQLHSHSLQLNFKPSTVFAEPRSQEHRRIKTEIVETIGTFNTQKTFDHYHSPQFKRNKSREYMCPHAELMFQKQRFIKKKGQLNEPFI